MKKKLPKKSFWKQIRFKYKLSFYNESTLGEVWSFRLSQLSVLAYLSIFAFILIALTSMFIILTPVRNYLPGYLDVEIRKEILQNMLRADSLEEQIMAQKHYIDNVKNIFTGNVQIDSLDKQIADDSISYLTSDYDIPRSERESEYVNRFEQEEKFNLTALNRDSEETGIFFYKPLNGMISSAFDPDKGHYGVDITSQPKENVVAVHDGTVIHSGFDPRYGNMIILQHSNDFTSVYKHNDLLLKVAGERVIAGQAIAVSGNTGEMSTGPHLHFELWHRGSPVNPEDYIVF
ncbi:MAG: M23 family metallopeptidase [Tannerella sp.]|jgi:lipoprotein NlpD|nr:M23 family metallopeptidase [Tannerella sp.]